MGSGVLGGGTPEQAVQPQCGEESQESREGEPCVGEASPEANQWQTGRDCLTGVSVSQILRSNRPNPTDGFEVQSSHTTKATK